MPRSNQGHIAICTLVDAATGFIITNPVTDKTSTGVVDILVNKFIPYLGCPEYLVTDQGKENVNSEIAALFQKYKINHIKSSVGHPQSNGMVERRQQMILSFLRKATQSYSDQGNWNLLLSDFQLVANSTISKSRKFSPFFLTFFRTGNFSFSEIKQSNINLNENSQVAEHFNRTRKILQLATEANTKAFALTSKELVISLRSSPPIRPAQLSAKPWLKIPFSFIISFAGSKAVIQNFAEQTPPWGKPMSTQVLISYSFASRVRCHSVMYL